MSIYTKEVKTGEGLFLKWGAGDEKKIRIFGDGYNYVSKFDENSNEVERFVTCVLLRDTTSKKSEVKVWVFGPAIQKHLRALSMDDDWGLPNEYDIAVTAAGEKKDRKYTVVPKPKKELSTEDKQYIESCDVDIKRMIEAGKDFVRWLNPNETVDTGTVGTDEYDPFSSE